MGFERRYSPYGGQRTVFHMGLPGGYYIEVPISPKTLPKKILRGGAIVAAAGLHFAGEFIGKQFNRFTSRRRAKRQQEIQNEQINYQLTKQALTGHTISTPPSGRTVDADSNPPKRKRRAA